METITVNIVQDDDVYISHCLDYDIASQGSTKQEAIDNIKEAVSLFLEVASPEEIQDRLERRARRD
ncbi:MAG: type II toxin-antitoxin system HicB family antitoxin [Chloroflexi bacterium]|nr:type II toxin-antitoxin system HicB family antitoxin [Chloroflexota bacterium]